jgi:prepilin-type N-terminal cleavage/methylation domain-containing protein
MKLRGRQHSGFTIVELLIVIVVIAILAAITIVAFNGVQERARVTKANSELATLQKAVMVARISQDKVLKDITLSNCTRCGIIPYATALDRIAAASSTNLDAIKAGDPWGNPYGIDENEGEGANPCNSKDSIALVPAHAGVPNINVPFYNCPN